MAPFAEIQSLFDFVGVLIIDDTDLFWIGNDEKRE